jgi:hypothetical protein
MLDEAFERVTGEDKSAGSCTLELSALLCQPPLALATSESSIGCQAPWASL